MAATPLMVGGVVYLNTALSQGVAIDATTGETLWVFNPKSYEEGTTPMSGTFKQRGVAYWTDGEGDDRIFWGTGNGYLVCVDAPTGQPCADFGPDGSGMVDAMVGVPRAVREDRDYLNALLYGIHSPPIVVRDKVIHGSQVADRRITKEAVPGWVRAWDVRTGQHEWDFHTVPNSPDEFGADTWLNDSWRYSGNANVWSFLSGDNELGHVYLPTGTATNDYYGADRPGDNLFSESIIAVDVETGRRIWHFQAVQSRVVGLRLPDRAQSCRPHRRRSRHQGSGPGQQAGLRVHVRPSDRRASLADRGAAGADRDEHARRGRIADAAVPHPAGAVRVPGRDDRRPRGLHAGDPRAGRGGGETLPAWAPLFTPTSRPVEGGWQGTLMRPPDAGAATWAGAAIDPETGMLYVPSRNNAVVITLYEPDPALGATVAYTHGAPEADRLAGRGLGSSRRGALMPQGLPLLKPPYSRMTAIDMNTGEHEWMVPLGDGDRYRNHPMLRDLNLPPARR